LSSDLMRPEGMGWRISVSIVTFFGSVVSMILWLFFYAGSLNAYQNVAVSGLIFLAFLAVMGATWASRGTYQMPRPGEGHSISASELYFEGAS